MLNLDSVHCTQVNDVVMQQHIWGACRQTVALICVFLILPCECTNGLPRSDKLLKIGNCIACSFNLSTLRDYFVQFSVVWGYIRFFVRYPGV